ncbi:MAG TPA: hypothetical protein VEW74_08060, partial [Candidatus Nitrosotalea sp.]|nr:hypothetical protein [Candidatus Nitrosotalea sp.]
LAWVLFRSSNFGDALLVFRALFTGGAGVSMLAGWQAVLAIGILVFAVVRLLLARLRIEPGWAQLRPAIHAGALAGLLLALQLLSWPGISPTFIYFKF